MPTIDLDATAADAALIGSLPEGLRTIPVDHLYPHPKNPRRDVGDVTELADSIREHGIRQPLLAVPDPGDPQRYRLVIGHRRHAGAVAAGLADVPVIVDPTLTDADQLELMLVENVQRSDLSAVEEADGYQGLLDLGLTVEQAAARTGRSESTVRRRLRLVPLPEEARAAVHAGQATLDDVARLPDPVEHPKAFKKLVGSLGSRNFDYDVNTFESNLRERKNRDRAASILACAGVEVVKEYQPKNYAEMRRVAHWALNADDGALPDGAGPGWVLCNGWSAHPTDGTLYRPLTDDERAQEADKIAVVRRDTEERQQRAAAHDAKKAAASAFASSAGELRRAFVTEIGTGKRTGGTAAVVQKALVAFLAASVMARGEDLYVGPHEDDRITDIVGVDPEKVDDVDEAVRAALRAITPAAQVLVVLAGQVEDHLTSAWYWTDRRDPDQPDIADAWYCLLADLGYKASDVELAALAGDLPGGED